MKIRLSATKAVAIFVGIAVFLVAGHLAGLFARYGLERPSVFGLVQLFNLDSEKNLPTLFSTLILILCSLLLCLIGFFVRASRSKDFKCWVILAAGFLLLGIDESTQLHEKFMEPIGEFLVPNAPNILHFTWVVPCGIAVLFAGIMFLPFLFRLPATTRRQFIAAAILFVGGALGLEMVGGNYLATNELGGLTYRLITTVEESCEIAGTLLFLFALMRYIETQVHGCGIEFRAVNLPEPNAPVKESVPIFEPPLPALAKN